MVILYNRKECKSVVTCPFSLSQRQELKKFKHLKNEKKIKQVAATRKKKLKTIKQGKGLRLTKANRQYLMSLGLKVLPHYRIAQ